MNSPKLELRYDLISAVMDEAMMNYRSESDESKRLKIFTKTIFENSILHEHEKRFIMSSIPLFASNEKDDDEKYVVTVRSWYQPSSATQSIQSVPNNWKTNNFVVVTPGYTVIASSFKLYNFCELLKF